MSVLPLKTYASPGVPLFGTGSGSGALQSSFADVICSTITVQDCQINFGDGTHLSTIGGQLYFDNELVASLSSISSIGDWSLYPSISTIDAASQNIAAVGSLDASTILISSLGASTFLRLSKSDTAARVVEAVQGANGLAAGAFLTTEEATNMSLLINNSSIGSIGLDSTVQGAYILDQAGEFYAFTNGTVIAPSISTNTGFISSLVVNDLSTISLTVQSTIHSISTVSSLAIEAQTANFSTLWGQPSSFYLAPSTINSANIVCSTLVAANFMSTPDLEVSSINGHEFTENTATISTIFSNNISSVFGDFQVNLTSSLQFNPGFNLGGVNLGLGSLFGNLGGAALGGIGVLVGGAALGTGIAALTQGRQTKTIGNSTFELVNGTTQLQVSTLGSVTSSILRYVSSTDPTAVPGDEYFISTIINAGTPCIRSISDPLNTVSSPNSTIQYFGQWVALDQVVPPAVTVSSFQTAYVSSLAASTLVGLGTQIDVRSPMYFSTGVALDGGGTGSGLNGADLNNWQNLNCGTVFTDALSALSGSYIDIFTNIKNTGYQLSTSQLLASSINGGIPYTTANPQPIPSSFDTFSISSATISSINAGIPYTTANPQPVVSSFDTASISSASISSVNGGIPYTTLFPPSQTDKFSSIGVSSIYDLNSSIAITNANVCALDFLQTGGILGVATDTINFQTQGLSGQLSGLNLSPGGVGSSSNYTTGTLYLNASTIRMSTNQVQIATLSTPQIINISSLQLRTPGPAYTLSSLINLAPGAGGASQTSTLLQINTDLSIGTNDIICGQVRVGGVGSGVAEIVMTGPDGFVQAFDRNTADITLRSRLGTNPAVSTGYILDTYACPPFFSTINAGTSTAMMAFFPSTTANTIGVSTLSVMPPLTYIASVYDSTTQTVAAASTSTPLVWNTTSLNLGGFTVGTSTLTAPVAGVYELNGSIQFATTSGGTNEVEFWLTKNGNAVAQTNSRVAVVNNGDTLGAISIFDTAAAGDKYGWMIYSADNNMAATAVAAGATPAIPSVIFNAKRIG